MSVDPESIRWPDGDAPLWHGTPEHTTALQGLGQRIRHIALLRQSVAQKRERAEDLASRADKDETWADDLQGEIDQELDALDLIDRSIHFEDGTSLMKLGILASEFDSSQISAYLEERSGASYFVTASTTRGNILAVVADPDPDIYPFVGLIVNMPDHEVCFVNSNNRAFTVGDKDPDRL